MISTSDFGKNVRFLYNNEPYVVLEVHVQSLGGRGGTGLVKVKARNLLTGKFVREEFKAGTKFDEPDLVYTNVQYLYNEGKDAVFMDQDSYEQFSIPLEALGTQAQYLRDDIKIRAMYFNGSPVNIEIPRYVTFKVKSVEPGTRGNTATGTVMTNAELENGVIMKVPLGVKEGDSVVINTHEDAFHARG